MRCDQHFGLPPDAVTYLKDMEVPEKVCPHCKRPFPRDLEIIDYYVGMFEDHYPIFRHILKNGCCADEFVQSEAWSSGPCFFLGLKVFGPLGIRTFQWLQSEIDEA